MNKGIKRGDIYYVTIPHATGHEMEKDRPAVVVSCNELNDTSPCVIVVFCSGSTKSELPEHVTIRSTPKKSTAMCEHICTVDKSRLGNGLGCVTAQELAQIDVGIMAGLLPGYGGLQDDQSGKREEAEQCTKAVTEFAENARADEKKLVSLEMQVESKAAHLVRVEAELATYRRLYEGLLDRMTLERRVTA